MRETFHICICDRCLRDEIETQERVSTGVETVNT